MAATSEPAEVRRAHRSELTPLAFLERSVLVYPDKVAVVHEGRRYTYREFGERVNRLASALRAAGLRKGDRVAFLCPNTPALLEAHYGVPAAGGVLVALNYRLSAEDIGFVLKHSGARFLFADHEFEHLAKGARVRRAVRIDDTGDRGDPYEAFLAEGSPDPVASTVSGSPPTPGLFARLTETGLRPIHVYGSTELYGPYMICERQEGWAKLPVEEQAQLLGRQGVPYVIADPVRVVDGGGREVPADGQSLGEVLMRGNNVMTGYFKDREQTRQTLAGGWYHSGDLAVRHPDGYIELRDRKKDIIVSGGENISTIEVETAIGKHPAVAAVAVVATPDEKWGERPKAFVELKAGQDASAEDILAFAKERLSGYMRPTAAEIVTELPKTSTGKIQKAELRAKEWEGRGRRIG
jgi:acyl-CoA synthetase (AMP-forming)/AMP-acid ligase II